MENPSAAAPVEQIREALRTSETTKIDDCIAALSPDDQAHALSHLTQPEATTVLELLPEETAAHLVESLPESQAVQLIEQLDPEDAAGIVNEMESDEQADIIGRLSESDAAAVLENMRADEASDARRLLEFAPESAGGLMVTEYLAYVDNLRVEDVVSDLRRNANKYRQYNVQYAFVVDGGGCLVGVLRLRDLLLEPSDASIRDLMKKDPLTVSADATLEELEHFFDRTPLFGVPVTGDGGELIGIVRRSDVEEAAEERSSRNFLKFMGILGGEELRTMPLRLRSLRRLSWLSVNIVLNIVAASVIAMYQETLSAAITLAVFLPIISDMSGCSGNQAVAVSMRELSLGLIRPNELLRVLSKEIAVGFVNGIALGLLLGGAAYLWKGNPMLGAVVAGALALNTIVAVSLGGMIPLLLRRMGQDPALASGPILTTVTDMCGFFFVLSLASAALPWIT